MSKKKQAEAVVQQIYVGPSLSNGRLPQYKVFRNGIPVHLSDVIDANPDILELIVPVDKLISTQDLIREIGTSEQIIFEKLKGV